jgi:type I restriction enzyme, R subunit
MTPEERARERIDEQLNACGWLVQDRPDIYAGLGVAIREFRLQGGEAADYLLYVDGQAIGIVEAKPEGHTLIGVETQSAKYLNGLPPEMPTYSRPLPFSYESTGTVTRFTNILEPEPRSREVFTFHRPEEVLELVKRPTQVRAGFRAMPPLNTTGLWPAQIEAVRNLEQSLADNRPRSLLQMTTGSGKTFTAVSFVYRLIKHAGAKRVLFLVDRANLGRQTRGEFQRYKSPETGRTFVEEYNVQHLQSNTIDPVSRVCISTVQRLYSMLKGEPEFDEGNEESSLFENAPALHSAPVPVEYNPRIPIGTFDLIVVDECHRSIYNLWRQVLEYFDASLIGLTATPSRQTIGFFDKNLVMEYGHQQAVADGVNVGYDVYRIRTRITEQGARLENEPGIMVPHRDRATRATRYAALDGDIQYAASQLDRDVVAKDQIRLVIRTFRDKLFTEIFPGRGEVPKTLVFAKDDSHAEDITQIMREECAKGGDFCQKITYKTTGKKPEELLAEFRNSYNPRIAVTVDMIATGTDVKPLECVLFMRSVKSATYFEQMKGRGVRIIDDDTLRTVTPDATAKDHFVIVDAVGVCEEDLGESQPLDKQPTVAFARLLGMVAMGVANPDTVSTLATRLARFDRHLDAAQRAEIAEQAEGKPLSQLVSALYQSIDPDEIAARARESGALAVGAAPSEPQIRAAQQEMVRAALRPFTRPKLREIILAIKTASEQIIDEVSLDELIDAGLNDRAWERAEALTSGFRAFIEQHHEEIEALQVLYSRPYREKLRFGQVKELANAIKRSPLAATPAQIWQAFEVVEQRADRDADGRTAAEAGGIFTATRGSQTRQLADLVSLVRHAIDSDEPLVPYATSVDERYQQWLADHQDAGTSFTPEQRRWLDAIKDHIASSLRIEADDFDLTPFNEYGGLGGIYRVFGPRLTGLLDELNERLAA